jgi:hypothetical protein
MERLRKLLNLTPSDRYLLLSALSQKGETLLSNYFYRNNGSFSY